MHEHEGGETNIKKRNQTTKDERAKGYDNVIAENKSTL